MQQRGSYVIDAGARRGVAHRSLLHQRTHEGSNGRAVAHEPNPVMGGGREANGGELRLALTLISWLSLLSAGIGGCRTGDAGDARGVEG